MYLHCSFDTTRFSIVMPQTIHEILIFENQSLYAVAISSLKPTAMGAVCGGIFAAICAILFAVTENVGIDANAVTSQALVKLYVMSLLPAIFEEMVFRGATNGRY